MPWQIMVINGPNLNMLGVREPEIYGHLSLGDIEALCYEAAEECETGLHFRQTNSEGGLIDLVHECIDTGINGIVINPGGYTHSSVALRDALLIAESQDIAVIEVHLSNIWKRESFRHVSYISGAVTGVISGLGADGYVLAIRALSYRIKEKMTEFSK